MSHARAGRFPRPADGRALAVLSGAVEKRLAETHCLPIQAVLKLQADLKVRLYVLVRAG